MGGGGGGSGGLFPRNTDIGNLIKSTKENEYEKQCNSEINDYLNSLLSNINVRDNDITQQHLNDIKNVIGEKVELEKFLFGGSVAKHTYVDGLSDIDVLVVISKEKWLDKKPEFILGVMQRYLEKKLPPDKVKSVQKGKLAITVTYHDGMEIQLLPALRSGDKISIRNPENGSWTETRPKKFMTQLTQLNSEKNKTVVPTIKIAKSIISNLPEQKQPKGYHIENLALKVFNNYDGPLNYKSMVQHFFDKASKEVLQPIKDITGQSRVVDSYLGSANSIERKRVEDGFNSISRKINSITSAEDWRKLCE